MGGGLYAWPHQQRQQCALPPQARPRDQVPNAHNRKRFVLNPDPFHSDSEDKTIRVWDATKRTHLLTYRREDRFWILAAHPEVNLIAAGHDSGLIVFKLERERPAYVLHGSDLYYIKDRYLRRHNINSASDVPFACLKRAPSLQATIRSMALVQGESSRMLLLTVGPTDAPTYELYVFPAQTRGNDSLDNVDPIRGTGVAAAFVARNKFAVLDRSKQVCPNLHSESSI